MKALITGTGQDSSYLAELLLTKAYTVVVLARRTAGNNTQRLAHLSCYKDLSIVEGDVTDPTSVFRLVEEHKPNELYSLAGQSHVQTSFSQGQYTANVNYLGVYNLLEAVRMLSPSTRFYQASSSEMFGSSINMMGLQDESTPFCPQSPYGVSKLAAHHLVNIYRKAYGLHASCGILFNHESERRGLNFVTRKISHYVARLATTGVNAPLLLGNLNARRDWMHAEDAVWAMWLMLQQDKPDDYVVATGECHTVREFAQAAFSHVGKNYIDYIEISPALYRPAEVDYLRGDSSKARDVLGWHPTISFTKLVKRMVDADRRECR